MRMSSSTPSQERYRREQAFHDERFGGDGGRKASAFYVVNRAGSAYYDDLLARIPRRSRVLEYGCGTGSAAFTLAERGVDVLGIDLSPVAVEEASERAAAADLADAEFRVMNAEDLELPDESFDAVCGSGILHHLDLDRAMREIARVLRPGGRAVFLEPLGHNPVVNLYRRLTPGMRTPDEHPLRRRDLEAFRRWFGVVSTRSFSLLVLAALPLRGRPSFGRVLGWLERADAALLTRSATLAWEAWTAVIELAEPRPRTE